MATIKDLIPQSQQIGKSPIAMGAWYAKFVAPIPVLLTDKAYVIIPDIDLNSKWGPCPWSPRTTDTVAIPSLGDEALVEFDNRRSLWVVTWWPA